MLRAAVEAARRARAGDRGRRRIHDRTRDRPRPPRRAGRLRRPHGPALHGLRAGRARGGAPLPHARGRHRPADHDLQQPPGLQGRPQAGGLPGLADCDEHRRDQGILARQPPHHRHAGTCSATASSCSAASTTWCSRTSCSAPSAGSRAWSTPSRARPCACSSSPPPAEIDEAAARSIAGSCRCCTSTWTGSSSSTSSSPTRLTGRGAEWVRAPRLPLVGEERERVEAIVRRAIETRPNLG